MVNLVESHLALSAISPSGRSMSVSISDDKTLTARLGSRYIDGVVWVTVLAAAEAVGPIALPEYLAHQTNALLLPSLVALNSKRGDPGKLPPCSHQ